VAFFQEFISTTIMEFLINEIPPHGEKVLQSEMVNWEKQDMVLKTTGIN
jgi:hypothetical protein